MRSIVRCDNGATDEDASNSTHGQRHILQIREVKGHSNSPKK